ncbi:MAG: lytic transglycosylase domain-containing protein [Treponema sp.]|nr:lytic transglycosylase domain-containing protein [Treponema sp.]
MRFELWYPVFTGAIVSVIVCFCVIFHRYPSETKGQDEEILRLVELPDPGIPEEPEEELQAVSFSGWESPSGHDPLLDAYRNDESRDRVVEFFGEIIRSGELAAVILANADTFDISPGLAFALCWEESRFKTRAVNRKNRNDSIDRGLFQLNSISFSDLTEEAFFDPNLNAYYGMAHLRWCLDTGGSAVAGLAMYNAGTNRVNEGGTPKKTLDYVSRVLKIQAGLEDLFSEYQALAAAPLPVAEIPAPPPPEPEPKNEGWEIPRPHLALLSPVRARP